MTKRLLFAQPIKPDPYIEASSLLEGNYELTVKSGASKAFTDIGRAVWMIARALDNDAALVSINVEGNVFDWNIVINTADLNIAMKCGPYQDNVGDIKDCIVQLMFEGDDDKIEIFTQFLTEKLDHNPFEINDWDNFSTKTGVSKDEVLNAWESLLGENFAVIRGREVEPQPVEVLPEYQPALQLEGEPGATSPHMPMAEPMEDLGELPAPEQPRKKVRRLKKVKLKFKTPKVSTRKCPKCGEIVEVNITDGPIQFQCTSCGLKGKFKRKKREIPESPPPEIAAQELPIEEPSEIPEVELPAPEILTDEPPEPDVISEARPEMPEVEPIEPEVPPEIMPGEEPAEPEITPEPSPEIPPETEPEVPPEPEPEIAEEVPTPEEPEPEPEIAEEVPTSEEPEPEPETAEEVPMAEEPEPEPEIAEEVPMAEEPEPEPEIAEEVPTPEEPEPETSAPEAAPAVPLETMAAELIPTETTPETEPELEAPISEPEESAATSMADSISATPLTIPEAEELEMAQPPEPAPIYPEEPVEEEHLPTAEPAPDLEQRSEDELYDNARGYMNEGKFIDAIARLDEILAINPNYIDAWSEKGVALWGIGRLGEAIDCYNKAIELDQNNSETLINKGVALNALGKKDEAIATYDQAIMVNEDVEEAWLNKGVTLFTLDRLEEAENCFERATKINPSSEEAWLNLAVILEKLDKYKDALESYEKVLTINPDNNDALGGQRVCKKELRQELLRNWNV